MTQTDPALRILTDMGDSAVTGSVALALTVWFLATREWRAAAALVLAVGITGALIAAGKIALYSRCLGMGDIGGLRSPSGHAAMSMAVYGTAALIAGPSIAGGKCRYIIYSLAVLFAVAIAWSRVMINVHTTTDVVAGTAAGLLANFAAHRILRRGGAVRANWLLLCALLALGVALVHGTHLPAEGIIRKIAGYAHDWIRKC